MCDGAEISKTYLRSCTFAVLFWSMRSTRVHSFLLIASSRDRAFSFFRAIVRFGLNLTVITSKALDQSISLDPSFLTLLTAYNLKFSQADASWHSRARQFEVQKPLTYKVHHLHLSAECASSSLELLNVKMLPCWSVKRYVRCCI